MSILVDTGVFAAVQNQRDDHHKRAVEALRLMATGRWGRPFTTDYIVDESATLVKMRTKSHGQAMAVLNRILGRAPFPHVFEVLMVTGPIFRRAAAIFEDYADRSLSFTDATTIATMRTRRLDRVMSFDKDFDGIVPRVDPRRIE